MEQKEPNKPIDFSGSDGYKFDHLSSLKENDLLLLSNEKLDTKNVKQLTSVDFLKNEVQKKEGTMLAIVETRRTWDKNYIEIKVDISN